MNLSNQIDLLVKVVKESIGRLFCHYDILYVIENANWCIKDDGENMAKRLKSSIMITGLTPLFVRNKIIHFGSLNSFITPKRLVKPHKSNRVIVTVFHIKPDDDRINRIKNGEADFVSLWHTTNENTRKTLLSLGIPNDKIVIIPLHIDRAIFRNPSTNEREAMRTKLGILPNEIVIGSFQKDGEGWGDGNQPKLIKGPDIFCDVIEKLSQKHKLKVILTGPARGYVKNRLSAKGIEYIHAYLDNSKEVSSYYYALDLYIIASRVEGGPWAVLESMASGVPLITTKVGMATDIVTNEENGIICDVEDVKALVEGAERLLSENSLREKCIAGGLKTVEELDYSDMPNKFHKLLYERLERDE